MQQGGAMLIGLVAVLGAAPVLAAPAAYDIAFVSEFADACVPGRLSYEATQQAALGAGWGAVGRDANSELDAMMAISEAAVAEIDPEFAATFDYKLFAKPIEGVTHYLVVSLSSSQASGQDSWNLVGRYLYNFDAAQSIDPEPVSALIGVPVAESQADMHITSYAWGPPPAMPRTLDTYLTFLPEVSQYREQSGFSGLVLKFSTSAAVAGGV